MKPHSLIALLMAFTAAPTPAADPPPHPRAIEWSDTVFELPLERARRIRLDSGPVVYLVTDTSLPLVEIAVALRVGSFLDPPDLTGLASLTGAMIRRGGTGNLDAETLDLEIDDLGARIDSFAGIARGGASLSVLADRLDPALDLFFEMLSRPAFEEERLENARKNLIESMGRRDQSPLETLEREWEWLLHGDQHFSTRPLTPASVARLDRKLIVSQHRLHWRPERMLVAVSGAFSGRELLARLDEGFAAWAGLPDHADPSPAEGSPGFTEPPELAGPPDSPAPPAAPGLYHYELSSPQAKVAFGRRFDGPLPWNHPDRPALALTAEILGGSGAISRLGGRLRTAEGLVYRASAEIDPGWLWPGEVEISFDTAAENAAPALRAALEEVDRLRHGLVHPMELEIARRTLVSRTLMNLDTAEELAGRAAENELLGRSADYWNRWLRGLALVEAQDVRRLAVEVLDPAKFVYLVVGPNEALSTMDAKSRFGLELVVERPLITLPRRDPLTMKPMVASAPGG